MESIDINCDLGEGFGIYNFVKEAELMKFISSCNIACGFHAGDPVIIRKTIGSALQNQVSIGAHPSYPDLQGFGRRFMQLSSDEIYAMIQYQVGAIKAMVEAQGGLLRHVKPHGALYNSSALDKNITYPLYQAIFDISPKLLVFGLANTCHEEIASELGVPFFPEAFGDRRYLNSGELAPRTMSDAVISDIELISEQVINIIQNKSVKSISNEAINIIAKTICIHSDTPNSVKILKKLKASLELHNIEIKSN